MRNTVPELYACLQVKEFPTQALMRLRHELRNKRVVVMDGDAPTEQVYSLNRKALETGITHGMTRVDLGTFPPVTLVRRSASEEATAKQILIECAAGFSPYVEDKSTAQCFVCVIDVSGTEQLFGRPANLAQSLFSLVKTSGFTASIAVSSNCEAAVCLASGISEGGVRVTQPGEEAAALEPLPLSVLGLHQQHQEILTSWGIHTLGMLASLSEEALISRLGQTGKRLRLLARGEMPHHFSPIEPAFTLKEHIELDNPAELLDSLLFVIGLMLKQLVIRAASHSIALACVSLILGLEGSETLIRNVRPASPSTDRRIWLKLIHLDLESHPPHKPVLAITMTAEPGNSRKQQLGLFSPQLPEPMQLDLTLARIKHIVGEHCVGCAVLGDSYKPDSFKLVQFDVTYTISQQKRSLVTSTASRKLRPPVLLSVKLNGSRPLSFNYEQKHFTVEQAYGPWEASGEWWSQTPWRNEQWDVVGTTPDNTLLCCCLQHDVSGHTWQIVAIYD